MAACGQFRMDTREPAAYGKMSSGHFTSPFRRTECGWVPSPKSHSNVCERGDMRVCGGDCESEAKQSTFNLPIMSNFDEVKVQPYRIDTGGIPCVQGSHLPAQNARTETTILQRIRRPIPTGWRSRSIVNFVRLIPYIKRPSNPGRYGI